MIRAVFLDVGNTLLFPQEAELLEILSAAGAPATARALTRAGRFGRQKFDAWLLPQLHDGNTPPQVDPNFWDCWLSSLMDELQVPEPRRPKTREALFAHMTQTRTWSHVDPEAPPVLEALGREGYGLGVISNADGTMEEHLARCGLKRYFRTIFDSGARGMEKPSPKIFTAACSALGVAPAESAYVGDVYSIDVAGAERAGLTGIILDRWEAYPNAPCPRITHLPELPSLLQERNRKG